MMMALSINPDIDLIALRDDFNTRGYVQIPNLFSQPEADDLYRCLIQEVPWGLAYQDEGAKFLRAQQLSAMSEEELQALEGKIYAAARSKYQYAYSAYPILDAYLQNWAEVPLLDGFLEALNDQPLLDLVRAIVSKDEIIKADAQATRFGPGQFLNLHVDQNPPGEVWLVAYVYNLTKTWQPDWGGYLQFVNSEGDLTAGLKPRYNVLNLLAVPQLHLVSMVNAFAGAQRYSITGWFRSK